MRRFWVTVLSPWKQVVIDVRGMVGRGDVIGKAVPDVLCEVPPSSFEKMVFQAASFSCPRTSTHHACGSALAVSCPSTAIKENA